MGRNASPRGRKRVAIAFVIIVGFIVFFERHFVVRDADGDGYRSVRRRASIRTEVQREISPVLLPPAPPKAVLAPIESDVAHETDPIEPGDTYECATRAGHHRQWASYTGKVLGNGHKGTSLVSFALGGDNEVWPPTPTPRCFCLRVLVPTKITR